MDAVYWINYPEILSRAQDRGLQFWQTKSHAIIVHSSVSADRIYRVISQSGDRILFERLSTPRPAPKVKLKSNWHSQQQQQQQSICEDVSTSTRRLARDLEPVFQKKPQFEIDLRVEGVSQDAILQDAEKTTEINKKFEKLRIGSCTKSTRNDLSKGNVIFSEESSRAIYVMGNVELIELRQTLATIQCLSCLMCLFGVWLRPNQDTMDRIRAAFCCV